MTDSSTRSQKLRLASAWLLLLALVLFPAGQSALAQNANKLLTNAIDVISLPAEKASRSMKVLVTGVVTASDPTLKGRFFVQDATGGVFVDNVDGRRPEAGELVEVSGITYAGAYAPTITAPIVRALGSRALPPAKPVSVEELMSGSEDSQRVAISAIVRDARLDGSRLALDLVVGGYRFRAYIIVPADYNYRQLIGSRVHVRGTAAEAHNRSLRQLISVEVYVPVITDLVIEQPEFTDPLLKPLIPLHQLAQYRPDNSLGERVHVRGVITLVEPGEGVFLQDSSGGLEVQSRQTGSFAAGDVVEAVGFPSFENYLPVLQDALLRPTKSGRELVKPRAVSVEDVRNGLCHAEFVSLDGILVERTVRQELYPKTATVLVLQGSNFNFTAEANYAPNQSKLQAVPVGSLVDVTGICLTEIDIDGKLKSFQILMGGPDSIRLIRKPSWFTPQRLLIGLTAVFSILIVFVSWTVMVSRKNSVLNLLIREREKSQKALQQAHDQLEERVKQRTAELKFQITARTEAEIQFKATLAERTRLAQELHDTVEQTLTGIALQLDTAAKLRASSPTEALNRLELARNLMSRSQIEVRQSVWDLRRLVQEKFDLSEALLENARQATSGTAIKVDLKTSGSTRPVPEVVEENFLRICQEALTNVIKHSGATMVNIVLDFEPNQVVLRIQDNGRGFVPQNAVGPREGHFGILGMSERVKRIGGRFRIISASGKGAVVQVEIPADPVQGTVLPAFDSTQNSHEEIRENSHPNR